MTNLIEQIRGQVIGTVLSVPSFDKSWKIRRSLIRKKLGTKPTRSQVLSLSDSLAEFFECTGKGDRSQGSVSSSGTVWECLVTYYLNLCLAGTDAICLRNNKVIPNCIVDAMSVHYQSDTLASEPDIVILSLKGLSGIAGEPSIEKQNEKFSKVVEERYSQVGVINLQCKTNWNDNAQVPMLWNMLYTQAAKGAIIKNGFSMGVHGHSLKNLAYFSYGFITVPSNGPDDYKSDSVKVSRVKGLSGGNFWGHSSKKGVARSLSEVFDLNFNRDHNVFPNVADIGNAAVASMAKGHEIEGNDFGLSDPEESLLF